MKQRSYIRPVTAPRRTAALPSLLPLLWLLALLFTGCDTGTGSNSGERALVRVGESIVTVRDFYGEFESGITAPSVLYSDPEALQDEKYRALVRLAEELIIVERARELKLSVSDQELARAVADYTQDFPDDTFEATLLENGISYLQWEKGLKRRLLLEKVIREDISEDSFQVPLPPRQQAPAETAPTGEAAVAETEEVEASPGGDTPEDAGEEATALPDIEYLPDTVSTAIVTTLPGNIGESQYNAWIEGLRKRYPVEIDWELWEKIEQEGATL